MSVINIKSIINRISSLYARRNSESWFNYLRSNGMRIGEGTTIHCQPYFVQLDITRPWLIEIGKNVQITNGVKILTHGFDWAVLKGVYGDICGSSGKVTIGDNCFIGTNAVILKGTTLGDNVIVGAGSVVTGGTFPSNCVIAGNPAKVICTLDEYHQKRIKAQKNEAKELVLNYYEVYKKLPPKDTLSEFFWLFEKREKLTTPSFIFQMNNVRNFDYSMQQFLISEPEFTSYEAFLDYCMNSDED